MIYFDENKQAYAYKIENPLCVIEDELWQKFSGLTLGVEYDIMSDGIVDLRETEEYKIKILEQAKTAKKAEASNKAYEYINNGAKFEFEPGKHIEANDGNISKLGLAAVELVLNQDAESTIEWCTSEDEIVNLNAEQLAVIVQGLKAEQTRVWVELYPAFLAEIEQAQTTEEVNAIVIDYAEKLIKIETAKQTAVISSQTSKTQRKSKISIISEGDAPIAVHSGGCN